MDPQIEEYRRKQRERAAADAKKSAAIVPSSMKQSWPIVAVVFAAVALFAVVNTQSTQSTQSSRSPVGTCPEPVGIGVCVEECSTHADCQTDDMMCCSNGCGHVCMAPEMPGQVKTTPGKKCSLLVTLAGKDTSERALSAVPAPSSHSVLSAVGILILSYAAGHSSDCCAAERALLALPDVAEFVEYDGAKPSCASASSAGAGDVHAAAGGVHVEIAEPEETLVGGWAGGSGEVDEESLAVWDQVMARTPTHENHDLKMFGKPVSVKTQVVAGTNYYFTFSSGVKVTVFHQEWTDTLEVSAVEV